MDLKQQLLDMAREATHDPEVGAIDPDHVSAGS